MVILGSRLGHNELRAVSRAVFIRYAGHVFLHATAPTTPGVSSCAGDASHCKFCQFFNNCIITTAAHCRLRVTRMPLMMMRVMMLDRCCRLKRRFILLRLLNHFRRSSVNYLIKACEASQAWVDSIILIMVLLIVTTFVIRHIDIRLSC